MFTQHQSECHFRVVQFDREIRKCVGSCHSLLLTDFPHLRISNHHTSSHQAPSSTQEHPPGLEVATKLEPHVHSILKHVASLSKGLVIALQMHASMLMSAPSAVNLTENQSVVLSPESMARPYHDPKHCRNLLWHGDTVSEVSLSPAVHDTFFAPPVPQLPVAESSAFAVHSTLLSHPFLFKVVTPIHVNRFEELLSAHLNQPFVRSVCCTLRTGFWPWVETVKNDYPTTSDHPNCPPQSDQHLNFITKQFQEEEACSCFSPSFGHKLLSSMYSVPVHAVPKPRSDKLRMVMDHSAGSPSLNDMIDHDAIVGTKMDGMHSLSASLLEFRKQHPDVKLVIFKSDVAMAYYCMPMHPLWQFKQVITDPSGNHHIDRCNNFGGRGSCKIWVSFMSLVV